MDVKVEDVVALQKRAEALKDKKIEVETSKKHVSEKISELKEKIKKHGLDPDKAQEQLESIEAKIRKKVEKAKEELDEIETEISNIEMESFSVRDD